MGPPIRQVFPLEEAGERTPMLPWTLLATTTAPEGGELRLLRRGDEFSIRLQDGNELMNSRLGGSEEALFPSSSFERLLGTGGNTSMKSGKHPRLSQIFV